MDEATTSACKPCFRVVVPNPRHSSTCDCTCLLTGIDHSLVTLSYLPRAFYFVPAYACAKFAHEFLTLFHLCTLSLAFSATGNVAVVFVSSSTTGENSTGLLHHKYSKSLFKCCICDEVTWLLRVCIYWASAPSLHRESVT